MKIDLIESQNNTIVQNIIRDIDNKDKNFIGDKLSDFEILQFLGKSDIGFVNKVKSKKNLKIYAMKTYDLSLIQDEYLRKYCENEHIFMKKLDHPNVCKIIRIKKTF